MQAVSSWALSFVGWPSFVIWFGTFISLHSKKYKMRQTGPFIHKFQTDDRNYILDVNTSQIVRVDNIVFNIIDEYGVSDEQTLLTKYGHKWGKDLVSHQLNVIKRLRSTSGLFSDFRPVRRSSALDSNLIKGKIASHLQQMILCVTERCNLRCTYCVYSGQHAGYRMHSNKVMTWNIARRAIDYFLAHCQDQKEHVALGFYGGEPLLELELIERCVAKIKKAAKHMRRPVLTITTNGTVFNRKILRFLVDNEIMLFVSLDGPQLVHDANRRFKSNNRGTFAKVMDTIKMIQDSNPDYAERFLCVAATVTPPIDYVQLDHFFSSLGLAIRQSLVQCYGTPGFPKNDPHRSNPRGTKEMFTKFSQAAVGNVFNTGEGERPYLFVKGLFELSMKRLHLRGIHDRLESEHSTGRLCVPGADKVFVNTEGTFYICERLEGNRNMRIGDIESGVDINRVCKMISDFDTMGNNDCCSCWLLRICHMCFAHVVHNHEYDIEKRHLVCETMRKHYHDMLSLYCSTMEKNPKAFDFLEI